MRKSPLSAPVSNYGRKNNYKRNFRDNRPGFDGGRYSGYERRNQGNDVDQSESCFVTRNNQSSTQNLGDNFIPLGFSSPVNHRQKFNSAPYRGHGNSTYGYYTPPGRSSSGGFGSPYRNNQNPNFNDINSPKFFHKQHFGTRKGPHQKDSHRNIDISNYLSLKSILEDPWAELMKQHKGRSDCASDEDKSEACKSETSEKSSCGSTLIGDLTVNSDSQNVNVGDLGSESNDKVGSEAITTTTTVS